MTNALLDCAIAAAAAFLYKRDANSTDYP
jgi:hypothetical protein